MARQGLTTLALPHTELLFNCRWCDTVYRGRDSTSTAGCRLPRSVWCVRARDHDSERDVTPERMSEKLSREFFSNRSNWCNPRSSDFKPKKRQQGLWIMDNLTTPWVKAELATERRVSSDTISDGKITRNRLWQEFFSDPTQWWDHRSEKVNPRHPDFKHKRTGQALWLDNSFTPPWVEAELTAMAPGLLQLDSFSWNVRLRRHTEAQDYQKTLNLYQQMQLEGIVPDKFTFVPVLNACSYSRSLEEGRRVHEQIAQSGYESDAYVATCLVDMYAKCGSIEDAWSVFSRMRERSVVPWTAMIVSYVKSEQGLKALELFREMQREGVEPDAVTFVGALNACAIVAALEEGRRVHEQIIRRGFESDVYVATCLVDMYAKCGSIEDAWNVFKKMEERNVISWSAMIVGYVRSGQGLKALELFRRMQQEGVEPNTAAFVGALNACASVAALEEGKRVHEQIIRREIEADVYVGTCLVDMYAKCGRIEDAWTVFNKIPVRNVVSWSAMLVGYVKSEQGLKALELFREMQQQGVEPDAVTFIGALNACASVAALKEGKRVHKQIIQRGYQSDVYVANCLVDMYAKCGSIKDARTVFNKMRERDVVSWNAMIRGYAMHGYSKKAIELFERMSKEGIEIDDITFVCLLSACSHGGLVEEGQRYFRTMTSHYNVLPTREHYACIVDLLGRAGWLEEAEEMTKSMPVDRDSPWMPVWTSLLGACRIHGNIEIAERVAGRCWELDPQDASAYMLLSNIYAAAGKWDRSAAIEKERLQRKVLKEPGCTLIEVKNMVHSFVPDDEKHPELIQIHANLGRLSGQLIEEGYILNARFLSPEEGKECPLCRHREKLVMAYGLLSTAPWDLTPCQEKLPVLS